MCVYWTCPAQSPLAHGTCLIQASASTAVVKSRQIRSGVQNSARPVTACRPQGPPTASLACATTGSDPEGTPRAGASVGAVGPDDTLIGRPARGQPWGGPPLAPPPLPPPPPPTPPPPPPPGGLL